MDKYRSLNNKVQIQVYFPVSNRTRYILYWNTLFWWPDFHIGYGNKPFVDCPFNNCYATRNRTLVPIQDFDAVFFHDREFYDAGPANRSIHQRYVFFTYESPYNARFRNNTKKNFYNWTMTYRDDSDVWYPYGRAIKQKTNYTLPDENYVTQKNKTVSWMVSNCWTPGTKRRQKYVADLKLYIPVDIYGECGNMKTNCPKNDDCYRFLEKEYLFYLSFENSMCDEYITEKLYNVLKFNLIPIVLGGSVNYTSRAPPMSIINTADFDDPQKLADYLIWLSNNPQEYLKYFEWKKDYIIDTSTKITSCELCKKLNQPLKYYSYSNIEDWYYGYRCYD